MKYLQPVLKTLSQCQLLSDRRKLSRLIHRTCQCCFTSLSHSKRINNTILRDPGRTYSKNDHSHQRRSYATGIDGYNLNIPELLEEKDYLRKIKQMKSDGLPVVHHHGYVSDLPANHRFAMRKFHGVIKFLRKDNVISMKQVVLPEALSQEDAMLAHTEDYVHRFYHGLTTEKEQRRTGFVWNEGLLRRCRLEAGGTILGARLALQRGMACSTGGGTHHANSDYGSGFCLLNDLAIAARYVLRHRLAQRVLIVDLDVHQGDGSAAILKNDEDVFTFSAHCQSNFPFFKPPSDLDLGLADHVGDAGYMKALTDHLPTLLESFRPDLVLFDAGVDPHIRDNLGKLDLTDEGLFKRDMYVFEQCVGRGVPCMSVIGGGYSRDIHELSLRHTIVHRAAMKVWRESKP